MSHPDPTLPQDILAALEKHGGWRNVINKLDSLAACQRELGELQTSNASLQEAFLDAVAERDDADRQLAAIAAVTPGTLYMDPPDGGNPSLAEQVARMAKDAKRYLWLNSQNAFLMHYEDVAWEKHRVNLRCGLPLDNWIDAALHPGEAG